MKLYGSLPSPFVRKVAVLAHEVGLQGRIETVLVKLSPTEPDAALSKLNPLGKIPALETDEGAVLFDSRVICEYLDQQHGGRPMIPREGGERWRVLTLQALADGVTDAGILVRYETLLRDEERRSADWISAQCRKVIGGLAQLEKNVPAPGSALDVGQIAAACSVGWLEFRRPLESDPAGTVDMRRTFPRLFGWYDTLSTRPSFLATAPR